MIGQEKLIKLVNTANLNTLSHTILFIGAVGSGKHTLSKILIKNLNVPYFDITEKISLDIINEAYVKTEPVCYIIDFDRLNEKGENIILKFIEEPPKTAYIICLSSAKNLLLPTIINRCQVYELEKYTTQQLNSFIELNKLFEDIEKKDDIDIKNIMIECCKTPGELLKFDIIKHQLYDMISYCEKIIKYVGNANFANTLTITDKLNFNNESDKWDFKCFVKILLFMSLQYNKQYFTKRIYDFYFLTNELYNDLQYIQVNKKMLFDNYLTKCRLYLGA